MEYFQMIMALLGVLALVFLIFWAMKKLNRRVVTSDSRNMKILERINLGPDKMLLLVSVRGKCMVLGVTNGRIEKVHELEESEEQLIEKKDENGGNPSFKESFKIVLKDMMNRK